MLIGGYSAIIFKINFLILQSIVLSSQMYICTTPYKSFSPSPMVRPYGQPSTVKVRVLVQVYFSIAVFFTCSTF